MIFEAIGYASLERLISFMASFLVVVGLMTGVDRSDEAGRGSRRRVIVWSLQLHF